MIDVILTTILAFFLAALLVFLILGSLFIYDDLKKNYRRSRNVNK